MSVISYFQGAWNTLSSTFYSFYQNPWGSITGVYNTLVNDGNSLFQGFTLNVVESFFLDALAAFLSVFGTITNWLISIFDAQFQLFVDLSATFGIFGPPIAGIMVVGFFAIIFIVIQALIRLL